CALSTCQVHRHRNRARNLGRVRWRGREMNRARIVEQIYSMNATDTKTYRGRTLEEVLPKIKAELGPDAEIVRQRSGLTGGVGGFFQRECVEVEVRGPADGSQVA